MDDGGRSLLGEHLKPTPKAATPARVRRIAASAYLLVAEADDLDELVGVQEAPPTRAPSMSGFAMISATLPDFTEPPYWMRTWSATSWEYSSASRARIAAQTSWASSEPQTLPVPMAQTGSYAITIDSACSAGTSLRPPSTWESVCGTWLPASRMSSSSPTHRIGVRPCLKAALILALTISSVSLWYCGARSGRSPRTCTSAWTASGPRSRRCRHRSPAPRGPERRT